MRKIFSTLMFLTITFAYAKVSAVVSIVPQEYILKQIGGDKVDITLMVTPGNSPHTYEPKPSQMQKLSKAQIYFEIGGLEFEQAWLPRFKSQNSSMQVVNISRGIHRMKMQEHSHGDEDHKHEEVKHHDEHKEHAHHENEKEAHHKHDYAGYDPHVWTSPHNTEILGKNMYEALIKIDPDNKEAYTKNYNTFLKSLDNLDAKIKDILKNTPKGSAFMVFHPAWGYFAHQYGLKQLAIESGGKNPKPKQMMHIIEEAKEQKIQAILTAPEFSQQSAKHLADELNIPVVPISPLAKNWEANLLYLAKTVAKK